MNWLIDGTTEDAHEALTDGTESLSNQRDFHKPQPNLLYCFPLSMWACFNLESYRLQSLGGVTFFRCFSF